MIWKEIPGYKFPYRISDQGEVQKWDKKAWVTLRHRITWNRLYVCLRQADGKQAKVALVRLMDDAFFGGRAKRDGLRMLHKNGVKTECSADNLVPTPQSELGRIYGARGARKPVIRYDRNGNSTLYHSVKEAAQKNGLSTSAMDRRIYGKVLDPRGYRFEIEQAKPGRPRGRQGE